MNKIRRLSRFFTAVFQILFLALPVFLIRAWAGSGKLTILSGIINLDYIPASYSDSILHTLSSREKLQALCVECLPLLVQLYILYSLISLFRLFEKGEIFSIRNVSQIRNIGYALLVTQIIAPLHQGMMGFVLTRYNPPGHRFVAMSLDQTNIAVVLIALIVILISHIMAEGCRLREEQQLTI